MSILRKKKLFIGTVETLFESEDDNEIETENCFKNLLNDGMDEDLFKCCDHIETKKKTEWINEIMDDKDDKFLIECMDRFENSQKIDKIIEEFHKKKNDDEFHGLLMNRVKKINNISELRQKCKPHARRFLYELRLFNRIPTYMFRIFASDDPLCQDTQDCVKVSIVTCFMIINKIEPGLIAAFYAEAGQSVENCDKLYKFFVNMRNLFRKTLPHQAVALFGSNFAFDLERRQMSQIDGTIVKCGKRRENTEPFIHGLDWKRTRFIRSLMRSGEYNAFHKLDFADLRRTLSNGLKMKGRRGGNNCFRKNYE